MKNEYNVKKFMRQQWDMCHMIRHKHQNKGSILSLEKELFQSLRLSVVYFKKYIMSTQTPYLWILIAINSNKHKQQ